MVEELRRAGYWVDASDIADHGFGDTGIDFLTSAPEQEYAAIVTNPPFDLARLFIARALDLTRATGGKVAMIQRHEFDAPAHNRPLFDHPYAMKLILHKRPRWIDGPDTSSPRFPYAWYIWDHQWIGEPVTRWLPDPDKEPNGRLL